MSQLTITVTAKTSDFLTGLSLLGIYGDSAEAVATHLVAVGLDRLIADRVVPSYAETSAALDALAAIEPLITDASTTLVAEA